MKRDGAMQCPFHGETITMIQRIEVLETVEQIEQEARFTRKVGFGKLRLRLLPIP